MCICCKCCSPVLKVKELLLNFVRKKVASRPTRREEDIEQAREEEEDALADQQSILFSTSKTERCKYYLTGEPVSIVCQNVPSYMGGRHNPWEDANGKVGLKNEVGRPPDQKEVDFDRQKASDGKLEISAFYSTLGLSMGRSQRISQSEGPFVFVFNEIEVGDARLLTRCRATI